MTYYIFVLRFLFYKTGVKLATSWTPLKLQSINIQHNFHNDMYWLRR